MKKEKKGFTLIEIIVVLAILAIITAIAVPVAFASIEKSKMAADQATIDGYNSALRMQGSLLLASYQNSNNYLYRAVEIAGLNKSNSTISAKATTTLYYIEPQGTKIGLLTLTKPEGLGTGPNTLFVVKNLKPGMLWSDLFAYKTGTGYDKLGARPIINYY